MTRKIHLALALLVLAAGFTIALTPAVAQDSAEKAASEPSPASKNAARNSKEQNQGEKSKAETTVTDNSINFPEATGPVELRPAHAARITLKMTESSRVIYENIGKQANIGVLFDPDYTPRNITVDLNGVSLQDALKIVAFESRTFWRPVTPESIFVAADNQGKRREFEQQVLKTFYFPNISSATDLQDIVNSLRTILEIGRIQQVPSHQSILVRGTPEQMAVAQRIVDELNQSKQKTGGEYRLEFKIVETSDGKPVGARTYTLLIEPHQTGRLRIGPRVPVRAKDNEWQYVDVGKNIDCEIRVETEHTVSLHLTIDVSDVSGPERGGADAGQFTPVIQQVRMETRVTLELGTPMTIGGFQDPVSKHNFQIEVTAVRTKSKE